MFDIKWIRQNPESFDAGLAGRGIEPMAERLIALDKSRREARTRAQELRTVRNSLAGEIGRMKAKGEDVSDIVARVSQSKERQAKAEERAKREEETLSAALMSIPNIPANDVPDGRSEADNVEIRKVGEPRSFDFTPKEHFDLGEDLGLMDFAGAAKLSGARFVVLKGSLARLERALANFMLDIQCGEFGYEEVSPPVLVRDAALYGAGQLPKFGQDLFRTGEGLWMIPTAEVPLANLVAGDILDADDLPIRRAAMTCCFRSEAGAAGKDTRGMIRQHQFIKVELVSVTAPDRSDEELERMTNCAEEILKRLDLAYRVVTLCAGDMGFSARKTLDIEVWLPGQNRYREISSCSNCGDFQARRMNARCRKTGERNTTFVHTLNGSGLAVGRALVAVLETCQNEDGSIAVPEALRPYMGGVEIIGEPRRDGRRP